MEDENDPRFVILMRLLDVCEASRLGLDDQLQALSIVWAQRAQQLRGEARAIPEAFPR